jgi:DNA-binding MarR family transcriptional regulator
MVTMTTKARSRSTQDTAAVLPLAASLRLAVMRLARRLRQQAEADLTPSMLSALSTIERSGPITLSELAAAERVRPPTITTIVGRLESAGLVNREIDPSDRRVSRVSLSPRGIRLIEATRSRKNAYLARRLARLDAEERSTLERAARILERLMEEDS